MVDPEDGALDPKMETAVFGREVEHFIDEDPIGRYIIDRAKADLAEASEKLLEVDPSDAPKIAALQLDARVAQRVRGWLKEAIQNGRDAQILIKTERDEYGT